VCSEALANAAKHARATGISIRLEQTSDLLVAEVVDDGVGGADTARGSGLTGLRDRLEALGGWLTISEVPGHGTRIVAAVPGGDHSPRRLQGDVAVPAASPISRS
jgi:signal transduction histidine kinase